MDAPVLPPVAAMEETISGQQNPSALRVFFFPFFITSHIIPMADLARQFASRGVDSTVVLTPANAPLIRRSVDRAARAGLPIRILTFPFPALEVGLPAGVENLATAPPSEVGKIYRAVALVADARNRLLREHRPDAIVADWWTMGLDRGLGIPWVTFRGLGAFPVAVIGSLAQNRPHDGLADGDNGPFVVPHLPDPVEMVRSELPEFLRVHDHLNDNLQLLKQAERESCGSVVNSFYELEPAYADLCRRTDPDRPWWFVGPLALCCDEEAAAAWGDRGGDESSGGNTHSCMAWLGTQSPSSVVFVCFGSWCHFTREQLWEIAMGLEASGCAFLWVVRDVVLTGDAGWLPQGFEERLARRGRVVRGWAPQVAVLNHPAVGVFVTHCGWNSVTEGVGAGVPMITWPLLFEQFINERLVVQLLRVGVRMHDGFRSSLPEEAARAVVRREVIAKVVGRFAAGNGDKEVREMRGRVKEYAAMARSAVRKGGSAYNDLERLIDQLNSYRREE